MQTFLPYTNFEQSAKCLDKRRCWQQVREAHSILNIIDRGTGVGYANHPAVLMWRDYVLALETYYNVFWLECVYRRGVKIKAYTLAEIAHDAIIEYPPWLGDERLHASHRSNLLRKDKEFYSQYNWTESDNQPYWWPTHHLQELI